MRSIQSIVAKPLVSPYRGSEKTYEMVREQIRERWGEECADAYNPYANDCMPLISWASYGYRVKAGSKALKSVTYVEVKNSDGEVERKIRRVINLFHKCQTEKV